MDNSTQPPSRSSRHPWAIRNCGGCGFVYIDSAPDYEMLVEEMDWDTTWAAEDKHRKTTYKLTYGLDNLTRWRLRLGKPKPSSFIRRHVSGGRVLDLGCGAGSSDLAEFFEPYGIEISRSLARKADGFFKKHGGYAINAPCIEGLQQFPAGFFDACVARSYLEHETDPLGVLKEVFRALKPGGVLAVKVPNYATVNRLVMGRKWCGFRYPDHLNYFTPASLRGIAKMAGFSTNFRWRDRLPTDDNMWAVLRKPAAIPQEPL
ncbi:MAG: class I SAM-dependent methyltransferase [Rhodomicrobium sp.]